MTEYAVCDPRTGQVVRSYPTATDADIAAALDRTSDAYARWGRISSVADRAKLLLRVAELHQERAQELADIIVREMGKPREQALVKSTG